MVLDLTWKSSPGCSDLARFGTTVADVFLWDGNSVSRERYDFVLRLVHLRMTMLLEGEDVADDLNVFIKREPHKEEKLEAGRLRLISAVSLVDTLVDRLLFSWLSRRVVASVGETPCFVGSSLLGGGYRGLRPRGKRYYCIDKSSWDWTVKSWMVKSFEFIVKSLCVEAPPWWGQLVSSRFRMLFEKAVFRFGDGTRVVQGTGGIMKSGCYLTIIMNSVLQTMVHHVAALSTPCYVPSPRTLGDDTYQEVFECLDIYLDRLRRIGARPKPTKPTDYIEFAGMISTDSMIVPAYWKKHLFQMQYGFETIAEKLRSYQMLYWFNKNMLSLVRSAVLRNCPEAYLADIELEAYWEGTSFVSSQFVFCDV